MKNPNITTYEEKQIQRMVNELLVKDLYANIFSRPNNKINNKDVNNTIDSYYLTIKN